MNRQLAEEERSGMRGLWAEDGIRIVYTNNGFGSSDWRGEKSYEQAMGLEEWCDMNKRWTEEEQFI